MRALPILCIALSGCTQSKADAYDEAIAHALACIERQVPDGTKVSAERAHSIVEGCEPELEGWTRAHMELTFGRSFDANDPEMIDAYNRELGDKTELMRLRISDELDGKFPAV